jgi:Na+/melibiose symporter-like transporter
MSLLIAILIAVALVLALIYFVWPHDSDIPFGFALWFAFCAAFGFALTGLIAWALFTFATNYKG